MDRGSHSKYRVGGKIISQKAKVDWLQLGDSNNAYFNAIVKGNNKQIGLYKVEDQNRKVLVDTKDIETKIITFYQALVGEAALILRHVDVEVLRDGKQLSRTQQDMLIQ